MTSLPTSEPITAELVQLAELLVGRPVHGVSRSGFGGNNRVYRIETATCSFALKLYSRSSEDPRDRLGTELAALSFFARCGVAGVPRPVAVDHAAGAALHTWIEGTTVGPARATDIDAATAFAATLADLARLSDAKTLPFASEACLSGGELVTQIERRLLRLESVAASEPALAKFLGAGVRPTLASWCGAAVMAREELAVEWRTLSPSDFGFHNARRQPDGTLIFLDFEYFGWDDPVKLTADFLLHPGMQLDSSAKQRFLAEMCRIFAKDATFQARLAMLYPLYGLRWCLILLNEFLPERWSRRAYAGVTDREFAQARQLAKAQSLLEILLNDDRRLSFVT